MFCVIFVLGGGVELFMDLLESVHAKAKRAAFLFIFLLYCLHVVPECLLLPAKCCKNLSFDLADGKDVLAHEAQLIKYHIRHPQGIRVLEIFCPNKFIHLYHMTS